ncbi:hypothetical protein V5O48_004364 [Marasmius crinis-equi]|uniref:Survival protein SurE-like phosphatase/nucleotidase domain-containing protein n=1 Tax=Marasmius crinis-equi TaxID=585013 RepID=A0ABR3FQ93_9AGAR
MKTLALLSFVALALGQNIVLTNDDGWAVAMIRAQNDALKAAGYRTVLSAPADNRSGTGSSSATPTTLEQPCQFDTCPAGSPPEGSEADDPTINYVNSFPVDAVRFGIQTLAPRFFGGAPDFVVSGPNVGNNLQSLGGSGTVGAATEAALEGIPSVAFSASSSSISSVSFTTLTSSPNSSGTRAARLYAQLTVEFTDALLASSATPILPRNISINVNYPPVTSRCADASDFRFVLTRVAPDSGATDVNTCGTTHLPGESNVIARSDCFVSVSVMDARTKSDKIVITNDDGWAVAMIRAQNDALKAAGYQTVLSAPADNQSGTGSSSSPPTTLEQPCQFDSCPAGSPPEGSEADDPTINYVNSFPVDAVRFGIQTLAPQFLGGAPDLVVSGPNIGNNVVLLGGSGTVGAATEAALEGVPSVAFSASSDSLDSVSFTTLTSSPDSSGTLAARLYAQLSVKLTDALLASPIRPILPPNISLNVNYPPVSSQCSDVSDFHYVLTRVFPNLFGIFTDVDTCGSTSLPDEGLVILRSDCFVSVSVMDARTKTDVNAATQEAVLNRIAGLLSCLPD